MLIADDFKRRISNHAQPLRRHGLRAKDMMDELSALGLRHVGGHEVWIRYGYVWFGVAVAKSRFRFQSGWRCSPEVAFGKSNEKCRMRMVMHLDAR